MIFFNWLSFHLIPWLFPYSPRRTLFLFCIPSSPACTVVCKGWDGFKRTKCSSQLSFKQHRDRKQAQALSLFSPITPPCHLSACLIWANKPALSKLYLLLSLGGVKSPGTCLPLWLFSVFFFFSLFSLLWAIRLDFWKKYYLMVSVNYTSGQKAVLNPCSRSL